MKFRNWDYIFLLLAILVAVVCGWLTGGMAQSTVMLTSNLNEGNTAYDTQTVIFRCSIRGFILTWSSEEYVGSGGYTLQFASVHSPGRTNSSVNVPTTTATLISTTTENGVTVLVSELRIRATVQRPTSSVTCRVNGGGAENTTSFRVIPTDVLLTNNLTEESIAYDGQMVTFRCMIRGTGTILTWSSEEYVGLGGYTLQFASVHSPGRTNSSVRVPTTTTTLISTTTDAESRVTEIISELYIEATMQRPTSSVTCRVNGGGAENTTAFQILLSKEKRPEYLTTSFGEIAETEGSDSSTTVTSNKSREDNAKRSKKYHMKIGLGVAGAVILFAIFVVIVIIIVAICKTKRTKIQHSESVRAMKEKSPCDKSETSSGRSASVPPLEGPGCMKQ